MDLLYSLERHTYQIRGLLLKKKKKKEVCSSSTLAGWTLGKHIYPTFAVSGSMDNGTDNKENSPGKTCQCMESTGYK